MYNGKEYKAIADKTNFSTFWVNSENGGFSYAQNVGKACQEWMILAKME